VGANKFLELYFLDVIFFFASPISHALTLAAKRREFSDSARNSSLGDTFTNISVLLSLPMYGCSMCVSLELRYGTFASPLARATMTSLRAARDLLMNAASI